MFFKEPRPPAHVWLNISIHYSYSHCFNLARGQKIVFKGRPYKSYKLQTCETAHFDSWKIVAESFLHILMKKKASYQQNTLWADSCWGHRTSVMREFSASRHFFKTIVTQGVGELILNSQKTWNCGHFLSNLVN